MSFTNCLRDKRQFFISDHRFRESESHLLRALDETDCVAEFYIFMPEHTHFLVTGRGDEFSPLNAVDKFKQYNGFWMSKTFGESYWQKDYFDHVLRKDSDILKQMHYMMLNPVRRELCAKWNDYPYKGSTVHDLSKW
ncbi:MAG: hypothetical protein ABI444_05670 [Candidatus Kapaibacterium sp.]